MPPRFFVPQALAGASEIELPTNAARHVQVLRMQPGQALSLFDGSGGQWAATITQMGRANVRVELGETEALQAELPLPVTLAVGMPANDRMDFLVEKATELGVSAIKPLICERSVLRLSGERAEKKVAHWQAVAIAACEQCGRTRVPLIAPVQSLPTWLIRLDCETGNEARWLLSPGSNHALRDKAASAKVLRTVVLSGPEGGLTPAEETTVQAQGFKAVNLGPRILRADTAPLAVMAWLALQ